MMRPSMIRCAGCVLHWAVTDSHVTANVPVDTELSTDGNFEARPPCNPQRHCER
jgi:hypothetical protein